MRRTFVVSPVLRLCVTVEFYPDLRWITHLTIIGQCDIARWTEKKKTAVCVSVTICFFFPGRKLLKPWLTGNSAWIKISGGCENAAVMVCWVLVGFPSVLLWGVFGEIYPVGARTRRCLVCMLTPTLWLDRSCCTRQTGNRVSVASMFSDSLFALSLADQSNLTSSKPSFIICSRSPSMAGWQTFVCFIYLGGEYILLLFA